MSDEKQTPPPTRRALIQLHAASDGKWEACLPCNGTTIINTIKGKQTKHPDAAIEALVYAVVAAFEIRAGSLIVVPDVCANTVIFRATIVEFFSVNLTAFFLDPLASVRAAEAFLFRSDREARA